MPGTSVVGVQWGDEGKGKMMDLLTERADMIVRFQGGANAGHTVVTRGQTFVFHLIPSGILHQGKMNILGNGVVVDPRGILDEMRDFISRGVVIEDSFLISGKAHIVMPWHKALEAAQEKRRTAKIGTTMRGIGPCYMDKMSRTGLRMMDLVDFDRFTRKVREVLPEKNHVLVKAWDAEAIQEEALLEEFEPYSKKLEPYVAQVGPVIRKALKEGRTVFFEGAQGAMLDIDHGTYPFVTSSNSCAVGIPAGAGVSPNAVGDILGVVKAYTTRVGEGPFPTELHGELGETLRQRGGEYGATTGRPRRCGWLDGVALRYSVDLNGLKSLAVTKLDVLGGLDKLKICTAYDTPSGRLTEYPEDVELLDQVTPHYEEFPAWEEDLSGIRNFDKLPEAAHNYLDAFSKIAGVPIDIVSLGPDREQTLFKPGNPWLT
ncbi:MAG: adenylosuccinate synthase [Planctomycetota bacterium]|jgi:adenylosuccinate synthase